MVFLPDVIYICAHSMEAHKYLIEGTPKKCKHYDTTSKLCLDSLEKCRIMKYTKQVRKQ